MADAPQAIENNTVLEKKTDIFMFRSEANHRRVYFSAEEKIVRKKENRFATEEYNRMKNQNV